MSETEALSVMSVIMSATIRNGSSGIVGELILRKVKWLTLCLISERVKSGDANRKYNYNHWARTGWDLKI